jgi:hypothetical protein
MSPFLSIMLSLFWAGNDPAAKGYRVYYREAPDLQSVLSRTNWDWNVGTGKEKGYAINVAPGTFHVFLVREYFSDGTEADCSRILFFYFDPNLERPCEP